MSRSGAGSGGDCAASATAAALEGYLAPAAGAQAELREKGSRFLALIAPAADPAAAEKELAELRATYPDATHHCWAWRLGERFAERCSDDGEPSGTAGMPMLQVLRGAELSDVQATVVRWYGGTNLGKGGLARAYAGSLVLALQELETVRRVPTVELTVRTSYERVGAIKRLVQPPKVELVTERYGEYAEFELKLFRSELDRMTEALSELRAEWRDSDHESFPARG